MGYLMMIHCNSSMTKCDELLTMAHPDWSKRQRLSRRLCLDYSSPKDWNEENLKLKDTNIAALWESGHMRARAKALEVALINSSDSIDSLVLIGCTIKKPCGKLIGVRENINDTSREEEDAQLTLQDEDDNEPVIPLTDLINCPTIEIDGKTYIRQQ